VVDLSLQSVKILVPRPGRQFSIDSGSESFFKKIILIQEVDLRMKQISKKCLEH
jgi:hypothetical protein